MRRGGWTCCPRPFPEHTNDSAGRLGRLRNGGDAESADLLQDVIYEEEITHCAAGVRWLTHLHALALSDAADDSCEWVREARAHTSVEGWFHSLMRQNFKGVLKPPFNEEARAKAGFGPEWYLPLTTRGDGDKPGTTLPPGSTGHAA